MGQVEFSLFLAKKFGETAQTPEGFDALRWVDFEFDHFQDAIIEEMNRRRMAEVFKHFSNEELALAYDCEDQKANVSGLIQAALKQA
jgi:uncharacterized protein YeaO (DUF488 family)